MNKTEIIGELAARTNITQAKSGEFVNAILDILTDHLEKHEKVSFLGFGISRQKHTRSELPEIQGPKKRLPFRQGISLYSKQAESCAKR